MLFALLLFRVDPLLTDFWEIVGEVGVNLPNGRVDASAKESVVVFVNMQEAISSKRMTFDNFRARIEDLSFPVLLFRFLFAFILVVAGLSQSQVFFLLSKPTELRELISDLSIIVMKYIFIARGLKSKLKSLYRCLNFL